MAPRFSDMILTYFVVGALMWATGFIGWGEKDEGPLQEFLTIENGEIAGSDSSIGILENMGGPIGEIVNTLGGGLVAVWNVLSGMISMTFWPIEVLSGVGAPSEVVLLLGGSMSVAFFASVILLVRGSA